MAVSPTKKTPKKSAGASIAALAVCVLVVLVIAGYFLYSRTHRTAEHVKKTPPAASQPPAPATSPTPPQSNTLNPPAMPPAVEPQPAEPARTEPNYPQEPAEPQPRKKTEPYISKGSGQLAIIIDDMGSSLAEAHSLANIGVPLTFSIIPGLRSFREVNSFAAERGIETMIHIPMQSKGWPGRRLEANGLLVSMMDYELRERVAGFIKDIPGAVGVNNHMGSEFTEHADKMRSVLEVLKGKNLFFVDSVTSPETAGLRIAREAGVKSGRRNVFLDNEQKRSYILGQLAQAVALAKRTGSAIAICHPHPATIAALAEALPGLSQQGITLVPASRLVR